MKLHLVFNRWPILLCAVIAFAVVLPRALLITEAHSPCLDSDEHLDQGLAYLKREHHPQAFYDPPLGKMILALPLWVAGCRVEMTRFTECGMDRTRRTVQYNQPLSPENLQRLQAVWKSLLFVPCVVLVFHWCRRVYGLGSAWLAAAMLLVDPTITGHTPVAALDVLTMTAVLFAAYLGWRYVEHPTHLQLVIACAATAVAMQVKNTALLVPAAIVALAILQWYVRPWLQGRLTASALRAQIRPFLNQLAGAVLLTCLFIWALTLFDFSPPAKQRDLSGLTYAKGFEFKRDALMPALAIRWPAGVYIGSLIGGFEHTGHGHSAYLWGRISEEGWPYYFAAAALYKVPLGIWLVGVLGLVSLTWVRPRWDELSILIPMLACATLIISTGYNVGFRHAIPTYALLLMLASRCIADSKRLLPATLAWLGVSAAAIHALTFHPDYLVYTNGWSRRPHLAISDSNVDWAQSLKQMRDWIDAHPQPGRTIWISVYNDIADPGIDYYLGKRIRRFCGVGEPPPESGLLMLSPLKIVGLYNIGFNCFAYLRDIEPIAVIGHTVLVYDLDAINGAQMMPAPPANEPNLDTHGQPQP